MLKFIIVGLLPRMNCLSGLPNMESVGRPSTTNSGRRHLAASVMRCTGIGEAVVVVVVGVVVVVSWDLISPWIDVSLDRLG